MKKIILVLLGLTIALSLPGCAPRKMPAHDDKTDGETTAIPDNGETAGAETDAPETEEGRWSFELQFDTATEEYSYDDGTVLATGEYERPVLIAVCDKDALPMPADVQAVCDSFNEFFETIYSVPEGSDNDYYCSAAELAEAARQSIEAGARESGQYFFPYYHNIAVPYARIAGDLVEVELEISAYAGGAHPGSSRVGYHFDLQTGEFFKLSDLTDDPAGLAAAVSDEIVRQIADSGEADYYFSGYEDTIRNRGDYNFTIGEDGLTFIFGEYEIGSYAMGILEFAVTNDVIAPYLNERGDRILLSPR